MHAHMMGILAIVPAAILLTISYFVLFTRLKTEDGILKTFGLVLAVLLWVAAAAVLGAGIAKMGHGNEGRCGRPEFGRPPMMHGFGWSGHGKGMKWQGKEGMERGEQMQNKEQAEAKENQETPKK